MALTVAPLASADVRSRREANQPVATGAEGVRGMKAHRGFYSLPPEGKRIFSCAELVGCIGNEFPASTMDKHCPSGEWYCVNEACVVREVRINCKLHGGKLPVVFECPACRGELKFHHWLDSELLLLVQEPTP